MSILPPWCGPLARVTRGLRSRGLLVGAYSALYFGATFVLAARAPLWFDELFTVHLARLPAGGPLWAALADGTDLNPPLGILLTRLTVAALGETALAVRLPAVIGFWVLGLCLFRFVGRRCGPVYGLLAALVPLVTGAYPGAYEARPYGLMLGFCGVSLVCWQAAAGGRHRAAALCGLAAALAAAVSCHYYAAVLLFPLALGETVRSLARRRWDGPVWLALAAGLAPLPALLPLLHAARSFAADHHRTPAWDELGLGYVFLFRRTAPLLFGVFLGAALIPARNRPAGAAAPAHEVAAAAGLLALPLLGFLVGRFAANAFAPRYAAASVAGLAVALALLGRRGAGNRVLAGGACLVLAACFAAAAAGEAGRQAEALGRLARTCRLFRDRADAEGPLVVSDPLLFLQAAYYVPPDVAGRLVFLTSPPAGDAGLADANLRRLRRWAPVRVVGYRDFLRGNDHFLLFGDRGWVKPLLEADGVRLRECGRDAGEPLFAADRRPE